MGSRLCLIAILRTEVFQSSMRLSKFIHRLNVKLLIVNGKLCPRWDWDILFQKGAHHAMHTPKTGGNAPTEHRRYTDVIQIVKNRVAKRLIHLANPGASA